MADIQFEEPQYGHQSFSPKRSWLTNLVIKTGLAKDDAGAQKVLLIILVLVIAATVVVYTMSGGSSEAPVYEGNMQ